jgi:hypothetical protein
VQTLQKSESVTTQTLPELRRPKPARSVESETPAVALHPQPTRATAEPKELRSRPQPPSAVKAAKKWRQAEIDEELETKAKAGKARTKSERRLSLVELEEEEDWQATELALDAPVPANFAIARPAKQASSKSPARVASTATAAKSKKRNDAKGDTEGARARHQELESKHERPERLVVTGSMTVQELAEALAVKVSGLSDVPTAGDEFSVFQDEKEARAIASARAEQQRQSRLAQGGISLTTLSARAQQGELKELNLILKADVRGSVEAIVGALAQLPQEEVQLGLLLAAPGEITETDLDLAAASDAVIVGFNTTLASGAREAADAAGVDVREYNIIYKLLEDIQGAMEGLLEPELVEQELGTAEVRAIFPVGRGKVAGCYIQSGKVVRNCKLRVHRNGQVIYEGTLDSLKRMKDDVKEVNAGYECGIGSERFNDWAVGDSLEAFRMETKRRTLALAK